MLMEWQWEQGGLFSTLLHYIVKEAFLYHRVYHLLVNLHAGKLCLREGDTSLGKEQGRMVCFHLLLHPTAMV